MSFVGVTFDNQVVKAKYDGAFNQRMARDGTIWGCPITFDATNVYIGKGLLVVKGRLIFVDTSTTITPSDMVDGYMRIRLRIDLDKTATVENFQQVTTEIDYQQTSSFPPMTQEDLNDAGRVYEIELGMFTISGGAITTAIRALGSAPELMFKETYDNTGTVVNAGGIVPYVASVVEKRNILINGGFDIAQRGESITASSNNQYALDRWRFLSGTGVMCDRVLNTSPVKSKYAMRLTSLDGTNPGVSQPFENAVTSPDGFAISFYVRGSVAGSIKAGVLNVSGGLQGNTVAYTTTWSKVTITIPTQEAYGFQIMLTYPAANAWVEVSGLMLNYGPAPIEYYPPNPTDELLRCRRYLVPIYVWYAHSCYPSNTSAINATVPTSVPMRITPTLVQTGVTWQCRGAGASAVTPSSVTVNGAVDTRVNLTANGTFAANQLYILVVVGGTAYLDAEIYD